jgi:hypothetical protein
MTSLVRVAGSKRTRRLVFQHHRASGDQGPKPGLSRSRRSTISLVV